LAFWAVSFAGLLAASAPLEMSAAARSHVPAGWKVIELASGDLNGDGLPDLVFVREEQDPLKMSKHPNVDGYILNTNTRVLVVLLADKAGYRKIVETAKVVMPAFVAEFENFGDCYEGLKVNNGLVEVSFRWEASIGSWTGAHEKYKFHVEAGRLRLIGSEEVSLDRASGEKTITSTNYLTGQRKRTTGLNEFDPKVSHAKEECAYFDAKKPIYLEDLRPGCR
jgi:hypothetical protein